MTRHRTGLLRICRIAALTLLAWTPASPAWAQASPAARAVAKEIAEVIGRRAGTGGAEAAAALARFGGESAVRESLERAAVEGSEALVRRVAALADRHGVEALSAVRAAPGGAVGAVVDAVEALPSDMVRPALAALSREADGSALAALAARHGSAALEAAVRQAGVGASLIGALGEDGVRLSRTLSRDQALSVARHAGDIAALPPAERAGVVRVLLDQPGRAAAFLDKHPRFFLIAGAGALFAANADKFLGEDARVVIGPDGKPVLLQAEGWLERAVVKPALRWLLPTAAALLVAWGGIKLLFVWRRERLRGARG